MPQLERRAIAAADIRSRASRRRQPRRRYAIAASGVVCRLTKINTPTYRSKHFIKKITRKKPARFRNRKHYQVALTVKDSNGFEFKRVRGWRQPLKTSMMMKKRVRKVLLWQERTEDMEWYQEMIKYEREFQMSLGIKPDDYSEFSKKHYLFPWLLVDTEIRLQGNRLQMFGSVLPPFVLADFARKLNLTTNELKM